MNALVRLGLWLCLGTALSFVVCARPYGSPDGDKWQNYPSCQQPLIH
ncbi:MAG: hypothetical protein AAGF93_07585 [Cyanobacteria bacterium P01_H01_bin.105]